MPLNRLSKLIPGGQSENDKSAPITAAGKRSQKLKAQRRRKALVEILDNIGLAREFVSGMNFVDFLSDQKTKYAVITCLVFIGKRLRYFSRLERKQLHEVPWRSLQATIRIASQQEWGLVERLVWEALEDELPALKRVIEHILINNSQTI